jgi:AAA domain/Zinc-binding domain of primase-helicase
MAKLSKPPLEAPEPPTPIAPAPKPASNIVPFAPRRSSGPIYTCDSADNLHAWQARIEQARQVPIENEIARRGIRLSGNGIDRAGPCPKCGGTDRFSINVRKQAWNCRQCKSDADTGDVIGLVQWLDGSDFAAAVNTLTNGTAKSWPNGQNKHADTRAQCKKVVVARFDFQDENGALLYQVERVEFQQPDGSPLLKDGKKDKEYPYRRPDPNGKQDPDGTRWTYDLKGVRRVPYRLPEVLEALALGRPVMWVEGPPKADLLWSWNIAATCGLNALDESAHLFAHADIVILPDNDEAGRKQRDRTGRSLGAAAATVRVLELPGLPPKGDIIDWANAGGTADQLHELIARDAKPWQDAEADKALRKITATPYVPLDPTKIPRRQCLYGNHYYRKYVSTTAAPGGRGKSSLVLSECIAMATGRPLLGVPVPKRLRVWYWNGEDPKDEIDRRVAAILLHFKIDPQELVGWLFVDHGRYTPICIAEKHKDGVVFGPDAEALTRELIERKIDVFTADPFVKTHGAPENDPGSIDRVARKFVDISDEAECAIELTHHVRKASNVGRIEITIDDVRGAGSLVDAARSNRLLNVMTEQETTDARVKPETRKSYFRMDDGKQNMAAPAETPTWFRIVSVPLFNDPEDPNAPGDSVGVATSWKPPGVFAGLPADVLPMVQAKIDSGSWAKNAAADDWAGYAVAEVLDIDLEEPAERERVKKMLKEWIRNNVLKSEPRPDPKRPSRNRPAIIVGERL